MTHSGNFVCMVKINFYEFKKNSENVTCTCEIRIVAGVPMRYSKEPSSLPQIQEGMDYYYLHLIIYFNYLYHVTTI